MAEGGKDASGSAAMPPRVVLAHIPAIRLGRLTVTPALRQNCTPMAARKLSSRR